MLALSDDAAAFAAEKGSPIRIEAPYLISNCCFEVTDCPPVALGVPRKIDDYERLTIRGTTVYVPKNFPEERPMTIRVRNLLGFRQLVLDGWKLI